MPGVTLDKITKSFGTEAALRNVSLDIADGEFCVIVGPSGCGKSTLLRIVAGLEHPDQGTLQIGGRTVNDLGPAERRIAMVFQSYALYPHMNVYRNMSFGLKFSGVTKEDADRRVRKAARMLQLEHLLERRPAELSGGERQRTAIGRAIVRQPDVFLFDEPLSNLDASLRVNTRLEIARLHRSLATTMIYVTHDQVEAMTLADRMVVMNDGRVEQTGTPLELYDTPANLFVAGFIGAPKMNFVSGDAAKSFDAETIGIRPEHIALSSGASDWTATVALIENLGSETIVYADTEDIGPVTVRAASGAEVRPGDRIGLALDRTRLHRFDEHGNRITA